VIKKLSLSLLKNWWLSSKMLKYDDNGKIVTLDLSGLNLSQVPVELGQLTNLQRLALSSNQLSQVPVELGQLTNLQQLTSIQPVEPGARRTGSVDQLAAACPPQQPLSQVPVETGSVTNLRELYLDNNQLSQVPVELGQLTNLQRLPPTTTS